MTESVRGQSWATVLIGLLLLLSPIGFATTLKSVEALAAYTLGAMVFLVGVATVMFPQFKLVAFIQVPLAVVIFFSPWLFGFTSVTGMAWTAWILAIGLLLVVGSEFYTGTERRLSQPA